MTEEERIAALEKDVAALKMQIRWAPIAVWGFIVYVFVKIADMLATGGRTP